MSTYIDPTGQMVQDLVKKAAKHKESLILDQLNELISRDLLVIEETEMMLMRSQDSNEISMSQKVRLVLKDQEYIESLESKIADLEDKVATFEQRFEDMKFALGDL
jgi:fructose-1,6-bisphosphatase/inositol monophosphatase family enzyme